MAIEFWEVYKTVRKLEGEALAVQQENEALKKKVHELEAELKNGSKKIKA